MSRSRLARALATAITVVLAVSLALVVGPQSWRDAVTGTASSAAPTSTAPTTPGASATADPAPTTAGAVLTAPDGSAGVTTAGISAALAPVLADPALAASRGLAVAGAGSALVLDIAAGQPRTPASTAKILTGAAALAALGPDARFTTSVELVGPGRIVLVGGGDPALSQRTATDDDWVHPLTSLQALAQRTADALAAAGTTSVALGYREDLFTGPAVSPDWRSTYVPTGQVGPIGALVLDGARRQPGLAERVPDPAAYAAEVFAQLLAEAGVQVEGAPEPEAPASAVAQLASVQSPPVSDLVAQMLVRSDNDVAEVLARHVARAEGEEATFAGAGRAMPAVLAGLGIPVDGLVLKDGSGLSRADLVAPVTIVSALQLALGDAHPQLRPLLAALPVAGFNGTLAERFADPESARQVGDIRAKTGFLLGVVSLAGYVVDEDGEVLVFAVMHNDVPPDLTLDAQQATDRLAGALAGCGCV